jgi:hypothetical protein
VSGAPESEPPTGEHPEGELAVSTVIGVAGRPTAEELAAVVVVLAGVAGRDAGVVPVESGGELSGRGDGWSEPRLGWADPWRQIERASRARRPQRFEEA